MILLSEGNGVNDIADKLSLSNKTVSTYRTRILEKMEMKNNAELNIIQSLQQIHPLEKDALDDIKNCIKHRQFPRNTIIQKAGMIASKIYFIEKGIVRHFYKHNKKEVTTWFSQEGEFISNSSFFLQQAGTENIENLEELHVSEINHSDFEQLCKKHIQLKKITSM